MGTPNLQVRHPFVAPGFLPNEWALTWSSSRSYTFPSRPIQVMLTDDRFWPSPFAIFTAPILGLAPKLTKNFPPTHPLHYTHPNPISGEPEELIEPLLWHFFRSNSLSCTAPTTGLGTSSRRGLWSSRWVACGSIQLKMGSPWNTSE